MIPLNRSTTEANNFTYCLTLLTKKKIGQLMILSHKYLCKLPVSAELAVLRIRTVKTGVPWVFMHVQKRDFEIIFSHRRRGYFFRQKETPLARACRDLCRSDV